MKRAHWRLSCGDQARRLDEGRRHERRTWSEIVFVEPNVALQLTVQIVLANFVFSRPKKRV